MKVAIIEDETLCYNELCGILADIAPQMEVSSQLASTHEARGYLLAHDDCCLVFADIRLADGLVFDALADVVCNTPVIFTTAYDEYAVRAFDYNGVAYLLKPLQRNEVERALLSVRRRCMPPDTLKQLFASLHRRTDIYRRHFLVNNALYSYMVNVDSISHIITDNGITKLFLTDGQSVAVNFSLDELCCQLDPSAFFRVNRQCIVHINHVKRLHNWFNGKTRLQVDCYPNIRIDVSKERTAKLKKWLDM